MDAEGPGSVTLRLLDLPGGDEDAARFLWGRYFERLVRLARGRLGPSRAADEEDVALSAFDSFFAGSAEGRFAGLAGRDDLWRLLVVITARKAAARARRESRQKRGGGRPMAEADRLEQVVGREPSPEFAAMVAEEGRALLDALGDDGLRRVAVLRMEGYTADEIAGQLGFARRTVARRLDLIRKTWAGPGESPP